MRFCFISERTFESWDWTNPETQGIGGSETSHIEMAQRLAQRGHDVYSYAPLPPGCVHAECSAGVEWRPIEHLDRFWGLSAVAADIVYVIYRAPQLVDLLPEGAIAWLICQDVDYTRAANFLNLERALKFTRIVALCEAHQRYLQRRLPEAAARIVVSSNGIKSEVINRLADEKIERNPLRMIYASSPDRGLEYLLPIYERVRELVPDAELHVCYGFNNIDKVIERFGKESPVSAHRARMLSEMERLGVHHYGRLGQRALLREWLKSSIWCHPSNFTETSCITCMDAQACGAVPVTSPVWAIGENVQHGVFIEGDVTSELVRSRYVRAVVELLLNPDMAESVRPDMMEWAFRKFSWDNFVSQWQAWAADDVQISYLRAGFEYANERMGVAAL